MNEAAAGERHQVGLLLPPAPESGRPLAGPAHVVDLLAGHDHAAVHDSGDDRGELPGGGANHRLVQENQALSYPPVTDEDVALPEGGEREEIPVSELLAELGRSCRCRGRAVVVALGLVLEGDGHQHVSALDALALAVQQPPGPSEPARAGPHLPAQKEMHPDPERAAGGESRLAGTGALAAGPLHQLQPFVLAPEHVSGDREQLEILHRQRLELVDTRQRLVGRRPRRAGVGLAASFEHFAGAGGAHRHKP